MNQIALLNHLGKIIIITIIINIIIIIIIIYLKPYDQYDI